MSLDAHFSQLARRIEPAAIRKVMALAGAPDVIAFTGGKPAPNLFPLEAIRQKTSTVLDEHGPESLQYASTDGYLPLRQWVAGRLPGDIKAENLMIISGSQQAIDLVGRVFIDPGDKVVVAAPTYTAALTTLELAAAFALVGRLRENRFALALVAGSTVLVIVAASPWYSVWDT